MQGVSGAESVDIAPIFCSVGPIVPWMAKTWKKPWMIKGGPEYVVPATFWLLFGRAKSDNRRFST